MTISDNQNSGKKPAGRTLAEFQPLLAAEKELLDACRAGDRAIMGKTCPKSRSDHNGIRATFLRFLALGGDEHAPVHEHGVQLCGAWIAGVLDLVGASVPHDLRLLQCSFDRAPVFQEANIAGTLDLAGSFVPGLVADRAVIRGNVYLSQEFATSGTVSLLEAQIGNDLFCSGARLDCGGGEALVLDQATIKGDIYLSAGFTASGRLRLLGAQIAGGLYCSGAQLNGKEGNALEADRASIGGGVFLNEGFSAVGKVRLLGVRIGGSLSCRGAHLDGRNGEALAADSAAIKGDVFLREGFTAVGEVRLLGAEIGGDLSCTGAKLQGRGGDALSLDGTLIKGGVFLDDGFTAMGTVRLQSTRIAGGLYCAGARFDGQGRDALAADGMSVAGAFFFRGLRQAADGVSLSGSRVGRLVDDSASWGANLVLDGFVYDIIAGGAPADAPSRLGWLAKQPPTHFGVRGQEGDFRPQPWQQLVSTLKAMGHREEARQIAITRQIHLRTIGKVGQTPPEWGKARASSYHAVCKWAHWGFGALIGYGHRPLRLVAWMVLVWFGCGGVYWYAAQKGVFAPSDPRIFTHPAYVHCSPEYAPEAHGGGAKPKFGNWFLCPELAGEYTTFSPLVYSLDLLLPVVDLQQSQDWAAMVPTPRAVWYEELGEFSFNHVVRLVTWFEILFGWLATLLLAAVVSGLTAHDDD